MALLVHYKQQMFYAYLLREVAIWKFDIIAHLNNYKGQWEDINCYLPKLLGYHPHMEFLISSGHRKYTGTVPDLSTLTESDTMINGMSYRYCVMDDSTYCPILLAKLLIMKNVVVLLHTDQKIAEFYRKCTIQNENDIVNLNAQELRELAGSLYLEYTKTHAPLPEVFLCPINTRDDQIPEDKYSQPQQALVTKDKKGAQHLVLTPTDGPDSLPHVTLWTILGKSVTVCQQMLLRRCWLDNRYPINRVRWVVQTNDGKRPEWWNWGGDNVHFQAEPLKNPQTEYVVTWSLNYYYFPHSTYAKIKLMLDNDNVDCVGSTVIGEHNLDSNQGYEIRSSSGLSELEVLGYRSYRHPLNGYDPIMDWKGWVSTFMNVPFNYNAVKVSFDRDNSERKEHKLPVIKLLNTEMRSFMNKLHRMSL